jgi:hypothetical protein
LYVYYYNTVSGEAIALATGHGMQAFNDLYYSKSAGLLAYHDHS